MHDHTVGKRPSNPFLCDRVIGAKLAAVLTALWSATAFDHEYVTFAVLQPQQCGGSVVVQGIGALMSRLEFICA